MHEPQMIGDRYGTERLIGRGGIGEVFLATDLQTGEPVAIKALRPQVVAHDPRLLERFRREGAALKELDHPNIVKILAVVAHGDQYHLVMEYVSGGSLYDLLKAEGKLPVERVLPIALDLSDALTRAHRLQIIHRDIKPANVLMAPDGTPRLTDFGAARLEKLDTLTLRGAVIGTVPYLSPEACKSQTIDVRTDIWSFGIMLLEMLSGRRPFDRPETMATVLAIARDPLPDLVALLPDAPPKLVSLLYSMLEKDPARRIQSMRQVGSELEAIVQHSGTGVREALGLLYRMLEDDGDAPPEGMRVVSAKLGGPARRASSAPTQTPENAPAPAVEAPAPEPEAVVPVPVVPSLPRTTVIQDFSADRRGWLLVGAIAIALVLVLLVVAVVLWG